jgi:hypothetical protein
MAGMLKGICVGVSISWDNTSTVSQTSLRQIDGATVQLSPRLRPAPASILSVRRGGNSFNHYKYGTISFDREYGLIRGKQGLIFIMASGQNGKIGKI